MGGNRVDRPVWSRRVGDESPIFPDANSSGAACRTPGCPYRPGIFVGAVLFTWWGDVGLVVWLSS